MLPSRLSSWFGQLTGLLGDHGPDDVQRREDPRVRCVCGDDEGIDMSRQAVEEVLLLTDVFERGELRRAEPRGLVKNFSRWKSTNLAHVSQHMGDLRKIGNC